MKRILSNCPSILMVAVMLCSFSVQRCEAQTPAAAEPLSTATPGADSSKPPEAAANQVTSKSEVTVSEPVVELPLPHRPYQVVVEVGFDRRDGLGDAALQQHR